jgi:hypothetical protein
VDRDLQRAQRLLRRRRLATASVSPPPPELHKALGADHDGLVFIEAVLGRDDAPGGLIAGGHAAADLDYGPRGPQSRPGIQL